MATLMDWLMQTQARGYGPRPAAPSPLSPTDAIHEQLLRQTGTIPDQPAGASITTRPAYSQLQSYVGGQDSPIEQLRMRGQAAMPTPIAAPVLPSMMSYAPSQFGGLTPSPSQPTVAPAPVVPIQSATSTAAPATPGIFNRIFSGTDYQSNAMPVIAPSDGQGGAQFQQTVNWGDPENAADYFRAAAAAQRIGLL